MRPQFKYRYLFLSVGGFRWELIFFSCDAKGGCPKGQGDYQYQGDRSMHTDLALKRADKKIYQWEVQVWATEKPGWQWTTQLHQKNRQARVLAHDQI